MCVFFCLFVHFLDRLCFFLSVRLMRKDPNCDLDEEGKCYCFLDGKRPSYMDEEDDMDEEGMFEGKVGVFFGFLVDEGLAAQREISAVGREEQNVVPLFTEQECMFFGLKKEFFVCFCVYFCSGVL